MLDERPKVWPEGARIILEGAFLPAVLIGKPQLDAGVENRTPFLSDAVASCFLSCLKIILFNLKLTNYTTKEVYYLSSRLLIPCCLRKILFDLLLTNELLITPSKYSV